MTGRARAAAWPWWLLAAGVAAAVFALSSLPGAKLEVDLSGGRDKLVHAAVYAALGGLLAGGGLARGWPRHVAVLVAVVAATGYGLGDEWHQSFVPNRDASAGDVIADAIGALVGALVATAPMTWRLVYRRARHGHHP